jgi:hypothetical protein
MWPTSLLKTKNQKELLKTSKKEKEKEIID